MAKFLSFLFLLPGLFSLETYAQVHSEKADSELLQLSGEIISKGDGEILSFVHILNQNTKKGTISDLDGKFQIPLSKHDTIIFSAVGYKNYYLTFSDYDLESNHYFIQILLDPTFYELSPVVIFPFKDEENFKQDILNLELTDNQPKIIIPGAFQGTPKKWTKRIVPDNGIVFVGYLSSLSREAKERKKYNQTLERERIYFKYNAEIIREITGLKEDDTKEFMLFCEIEDEFILHASKYEIILAVNDCYKEFVKKRN